jgi:catechol 2,3-dioxygenase-like lactoylglutathione lyase family enzyme
MTIVLNHTIVPARDKEASAQFFADIFGLKVEPGVGHFAAVCVNDTLQDFSGN